MMALATMVTVGALNGATGSMHGSAQRVLITAVVALLAPLFWPGKRSSRKPTAMVILAWSCVVTCLAALLLLVIGRGTHSGQSIASVCGVLLLISMTTHAAAVAVETFVGKMSADAPNAREIGGRVAMLVLALLGSIPVWMGPAVEIAKHSHPGLIDIIVGVSPLTHIAVAGGNDLLRNPWFYQHSSLSGLQFSYPSLTMVVMCYIAVAVAVLGVPLLVDSKRTPRAALSAS
jgi:hypothetical protein